LQPSRSDRPASIERMLRTGGVGVDHPRGSADVTVSRREQQLIALHRMSLMNIADGGQGITRAESSKARAKLLLAKLKPREQIPEDQRVSYDALVALLQRFAERGYARG